MTVHHTDAVTALAQSGPQLTLLAGAIHFHERWSLATNPSVRKSQGVA